MANGRPNKERGFCDYLFEDGTFCSEFVERIVVQKNGKILKKNKWNDRERRNYCIFHSHNDKKNEIFISKIKTIIEEKNKIVIRAIRTLDDKRLSEKERKIQEEKIREENLIDFEGFYFPNIVRLVIDAVESSISFLYVKFNKEVFNISKKFNGIADFRNANFCKEANFAFSRFNNIAIFVGTVFNKEAIFRRSSFFKEAAFVATKFYDLADFESVNFSEQASFWDTVFKGKANYQNAIFDGPAYFNRCFFQFDTDFSYTTHIKTMDMTEAIFLYDKLDFTRARFPAEETFFHNTIFNCEVLFHEQMMKGVRFTGCYLGSASFYGSDIRDAVFINSSWNKRFLEKQIGRLKKDKKFRESISVLDITKKPPRTKRRAILFDEKSYKSSNKTYINKQKKESESIKPELDPLYLEHLYCQFKLAMDRNKMYGLANDFYYGEKLMETKRLSEEHSYLKWIFLWLYRLLAGFGNSPWRAIISLILILFASSFLLIKFNGLNAEKTKEAYERCPCERNEIKPAAAIKQNLKTPTASIKTGKSYLSALLYNSLAPLNALNQSVKPPQSTGTPVKVSQKKEAGYSLKSNYLCNIFFVSLWNLTASPGLRSGDYKENGWGAYIAVFFIQYVFRPLMVALIIISVRRKVYRG